MTTLGLIVNSAARRVEHRYLGAHPLWRRLLPDEWVRVTRSLEELEEAVADFPEKGVQVVAGLGGDGTFRRCRHPRLRAGQSREATVRGGSGYLIDGDRYPAGGGTDVRLTVGPTIRFVGPLRDHPGAVASRESRLRIGDRRDAV